MAEPTDLHVAIVHASPGRVRIKVPREELNGEGLDRAERALQGLKGIHEVRRNAVTSSVLVRYEPDSADIPTPLEAFQNAGVNIVLENDGLAGAAEDGPERPNLGDSISAFFASADRRVAGFTNGRADLRTLVPVSLGALALRELLSGRAMAAPWYVLAWWAFDSFTKLRNGQRNSDSPQA